MPDSYLTISAPSEGQYTEKRSKFLAFAFPVSTLEEIKSLLDEHQKRYYDARHVCYAYMLGHERLVFRANDNGEPSGTAGKPILGQINSNELTDILIIVVRYFGGVKLGTSGLIQAYRAAAAEAIAAATVIEKTVDLQLTITFEYPLMNAVMRIIKDEEPAILSQTFDNDCQMTLSIRASLMPRLQQRLEKIDGVTLLPID
ncbi:MAG: YigZ family protein [Bacteroidaceae bacterium]|nr:YigZ family protein [Bacteroidaceae bacterium]